MIRRTLPLAFLLLPSSALGQLPAAKVPVGTPLAISLDHNYSMRAGTHIEGHLVYPVYANNHLVLPQGTAIVGTVEELQPDRTRRVHAILGGDFTPFRTPLVRFTALRLPDGTFLPLSTGPAVTGTPTYRAVAPERTRGGIVRQQFKAGLDAARGDLAWFIGPGKGDRLLQWVYSQLPYHPQRIAKDTAWTIELTAPIDIPPHTEWPALPMPTRKPHFWQVQPPAPDQPHPGTWRIEANLADLISSEKSSRGQSIHAIVAEPVLNADHSIAVPQGAALNGTITQVRPARRFGRPGVLTFNFNQLVTPGEKIQSVETRLTAADSADDIALNSEGQAKPRPRDRVVIPLILAVMASSPFDQDNGHYHHATRKNATAGAAGLGLIGTLVSAAGGSPNVAAGIGFWGAARSIYGRWIARGEKVAFPQDTRIVIETTPRQSAPIRPSSTR